MAIGRNASTLLLTLVATIVIFAVLLVVSGLGTLERHAYTLNFGWQVPNVGQPSGVCDRALTYKGFPIRTGRPADPADDPSGCLDSTNALAQGINFALCFAVAGLVSATVVSRLRN
jgi:hypothetical protein